MFITMKMFGMVFFLFIMIELAPGFAHAEQFVFIINTTAEDSMGPATVPFLDETRWGQRWKTAFEKMGVEFDGVKVQLVPIRANSNAELTRALTMWMTPLPTDLGPREVLGLGIYSHGESMLLLNESEKFKIRLPMDVRAIFAPLVGRFAAGARIVLSGCLVLDGQSEAVAGKSLTAFADAFGLNRGLICANVTRGLDPQALVSDPFNSEMKPLKRAAVMLSYLMWPLTAIIVPGTSRYYFNHGYALWRTDRDVILPMRLQTAIADAL